MKQSQSINQERNLKLLRIGKKWKTTYRNVWDTMKYV